MKRKKRLKDSYSSIGMKTLVHTIAVGSIPNLSGTAAETSIKSDYTKGLGKIGEKFPAMGSMIGTGIVLKQAKKLNKFKKII